MPTSRVPSQKDDLDRQIKALQEVYSKHEIVNDIASGINWKNPGLLSILNRAMCGNVEEVMVSLRNRLFSFAFDLFEHVNKTRDSNKKGLKE